MGGYDPKACDLFTGSCNLVSPGSSYKYGEHEVWKIDRYDDDDNSTSK